MTILSLNAFHGAESLWFVGFINVFLLKSLLFIFDYSQAIIPGVLFGLLIYIEIYIV